VPCELERDGQLARTCVQFAVREAGLGREQRGQPLRQVCSTSRDGPYSDSPHNPVFRSGERRTWRGARPVQFKRKITTGRGARSGKEGDRHGWLSLDLPGTNRFLPGPPRAGLAPSLRVATIAARPRGVERMFATTGKFPQVNGVVWSIANTAKRRRPGLAIPSRQTILLESRPQPVHSPEGGTSTPQTAQAGKGVPAATGHPADSFGLRAGTPAMPVIPGCQRSAFGLAES
jgi:hypothetical protein